MCSRNDDTSEIDDDENLYDEEREKPIVTETYPAPIIEPDYFLEMEYEDRFASDLEENF